MQRVDKPTFNRFVRHLEGIPVESENISAMQYINEAGRVVAQAVYTRIMPQVLQDARRQGITLKGPKVGVAYFVCT